MDIYFENRMSERAHKIWISVCVCVCVCVSVERNPFFGRTPLAGLSDIENLIPTLAHLESLELREATYAVTVHMYVSSAMRC